jgi:hypothetical protein
MDTSVVQQNTEQLPKLQCAYVTVERSADGGRLCCKYNRNHKGDHKGIRQSDYDGMQLTWRKEPETVWRKPMEAFAQLIVTSIAVNGIRTIAEVTRSTIANRMPTALVTMLDADCPEPTVEDIPVFTNIASFPSEPWTKYQGYDLLRYEISRVYTLRD